MSDIGALVDAVFQAGKTKFHYRPDVERWWVEVGCNRVGSVQLCLKAVVCRAGEPRLERREFCVHVDPDQISQCADKHDVALVLFGDVLHESDQLRRDRLAENPA